MTSWAEGVPKREGEMGGELAMISMALQREVPQYMAIPWFITKVMARTISANKHTYDVKDHEAL